MDESLVSVRNTEKAPEPKNGKLGKSGCPLLGKRRRGRNRKEGSRLKRRSFYENHRRRQRSEKL
jgi:hypothetical protein